MSNLEQTAAAITLAHPDKPDQLRGTHSASPIVGKITLQALSWAIPIVLVVIWELLAQNGWLSP